MTAQLRAYRFPAGTRFEGGVVGALERMELEAGDLLDALFVLRDPDTGALDAIDLATGGAGGSIAAMLDFRLDATRRKRFTERTRRPHAGGVPAPLIDAVGAALGPGEAVLELLVTRWPGDLEQAVERSGGRLVAAEWVQASRLGDLRRALPS